MFNYIFLYILEIVEGIRNCIIVFISELTLVVLNRLFLIHWKLEMTTQFLQVQMMTNILSQLIYFYINISIDPMSGLCWTLSSTLVQHKSNIGSIYFGYWLSERLFFEYLPGCVLLCMGWWGGVVTLASSPSGPPSSGPLLLTMSPRMLSIL